MKKTALALAASIALFGAACNSEATIDTGVDSVSASDLAQQSEPASGTTSEAPADEAPPATVEPVNGDDGAPADAVEADPVEDRDAADEAPVVEVSAGASASLLASDDWCAVAAQVENSFGDDGLATVTDPLQLQQAYERSTQLVNEAVEIAPVAIVTDVAKIAVAFTNMSGLLNEAGWDFLAVDLAAIERAAVDMEVAGYNIQKYNFEECGVGVDPGAAPTPGEVPADDVDLEELLTSDGALQIFGDVLVSTMGFSQDEANCVVDNWLTGAEIGDPTVLIEAMTVCGVPLERMMGG